jgi:hypothetical protein
MGSSIKKEKMTLLTQEGKENENRNGKDGA